MNSDNLKGKMDEMKGKVKDKVGQVTGDDNLRGEGAVDQVKGKAENAWGEVKDAGRELRDKVTGNREKDENAA